MQDIDASTLDEKCENCHCDFDEGDEYWWVKVEEEEETEEHVVLCDDCYIALLEVKGIPHIKEPGDNGD